MLYIYLYLLLSGRWFRLQTAVQTLVNLKSGTETRTTQQTPHVKKYSRPRMFLFIIWRSTWFLQGEETYLQENITLKQRDNCTFEKSDYHILIFKKPSCFIIKNKVVLQKFW